MHPADPMSRPVTIAEVAQLLDERMARQDRAALTTARRMCCIGRCRS